MKHNEILELATKLGFLHQKGTCSGFTLRWIEANLLGQEDIKNFFERILAIKTINCFSNEKLDKKITALKDKIKSCGKEALNEEETSLLDVMAFYDSMYLFQNPHHNTSLFEDHIMQKNIAQISALASSDRILEQGGLIELSSQIGVYAPKDVMGLLQSYESINLEENLCFYLASENHAIGLSYHPHHGWSFLDINQHEHFDLTYEFRKGYVGFSGTNYLTYDEIVTRIFNGFERSQQSTVVFEIIPITTQSQAIKLALAQKITSLPQSRSCQNMTPEDLKKLINQIIVQDRLESLEQLINQGVSLENIPEKLEIAIYNNSPKTVSYFLNLTTPTAAQFGFILLFNQKLALELGFDTFLAMMQKSHFNFSMLSDKEALKIITFFSKKPAYFTALMDTMMPKLSLKNLSLILHQLSPKQIQKMLPYFANLSFDDIQSLKPLEPFIIELCKLQPDLLFCISENFKVFKHHYPAHIINLLKLMNPHQINTILINHFDENHLFTILSEFSENFTLLELSDLMGYLAITDSLKKSLYLNHLSKMTCITINEIGLIAQLDNFNTQELSQFILAHLHLSDYEYVFRFIPPQEKMPLFKLLLPKMTNIRIEFLNQFTAEEVRQILPDISVIFRAIDYFELQDFHELATLIIDICQIEPLVLDGIAQYFYEFLEEYPQQSFKVFRLMNEEQRFNALIQLMEHAKLLRLSDTETEVFLKLIPTEHFKDMLINSEYFLLFIETYGHTQQIKIDLLKLALPPNILENIDWIKELMNLDMPTIFKIYLQLRIEEAELQANSRFHAEEKKKTIKRLIHHLEHLNEPYEQSQLEKDLSILSTDFQEIIKTQWINSETKQKSINPAKI